MPFCLRSWNRQQIGRTIMSTGVLTVISNSASPSAFWTIRPSSTGRSRSRCSQFAALRLSSLVRLVGLGFPLTSLQFPIDGLADEVGTVFTV